MSAGECAQVEEELRACSVCAREVGRMRAASSSLAAYRDANLDERAMAAMHRAIDRTANQDAGAMRLIATIGLLAASVLIVGLAWLNRLSSEQAKPVVTNWEAR